MRSAALNALTTFPRGQSARVPARPARKPRRRRMFSACRPRAARLQGRVAVATDPPWRHYGVHASHAMFMGLLAGRPLLREAGKVSPKAGWGVESRYGPTKVRGDVRAIRLGSNQRATPHPALRATFPSKLGKGSARRSEMCEHCRRRHRAIGERSAADRPNAGRPEMFPQRLEKIDSAPGNGAHAGPAVRMPAP